MEYKKIINNIVNDKRYLNLCRKICNNKDIYQDLYQYVMLYMLELPEAKILELNKGDIKGYIDRIIYLNSHSKTAGFFITNIDIATQYDVKLTEDIADEEPKEEPDFKRCLDKTLYDQERYFIEKDLFPFSIKLFEIWQREGSYLRTAKKTTIPYPTVRLTISNLIQKINENLNNNNN